MKIKIKQLLLAFICFSLFNCKSSNNQPDKLTYGYNESFQLSENESEVNSSKLVDFYEVIWDYPEFNLPINKVVNHEDYYIFIAAAIENNESETINQILKTEEFEFIKEENSTKFSTQLLYQYEDFYIYSVIYAEKIQEIPFVISWVSKNEEIIVNAYNNQLLDEKIN